MTLFLFLGAVAYQTEIVLARCDGEPADVVFVLDSSYSIWPPDFYREVKFMEDVIKTFDVGPGPEQSRIAALTFGHGVWPKFYLDTYKDKETMLRATSRIEYDKGSRTNTGDALVFARDIIFRNREGSRDNVSKIIIVVTDGQSQKTFFTQEMSASLQKKGILMFAVSIGFRLDQNELAGIASDPDDQFQFALDEYSGIASVKERIAQKVCEQFPNHQDEQDPGYQEFKGRETFMSFDCTGKEADIFFLVDSSFSINEDNFGKEMEFVHSVIEMLDIGQNKTRIGVMSFSDVAKFHIKLNYDMKKADYLTYLNSVMYMGGGTNTATALRRMREEGFFGETTTIRKDVAKVAIILTDGLSLKPDITAKEADLARMMGIQIFAIGIGSGIDKRELADIASRPLDTFMMHVDDFNSLKNIKMELTAKSCTVEPIEGVSTLSDHAVCHPLRPADLVFIYDSMNLGSWKSQTISQFVAKSIAEFSLATDDLRVGREIENCPVGNIPLGSALTSKDLEKIDYQTLADMLRRVNRNRFSIENGARVNASKMAVLFVDTTQRLNYETYLEAKRLKEQVDFFYVVSIGSNTQTSHLTGLAGSGKSITVSRYHELLPLADTLMSAMCDFFFMFF